MAGAHCNTKCVLVLFLSVTSICNSVDSTRDGRNAQFACECMHTRLTSRLRMSEQFHSLAVIL